MVRWMFLLALASACDSPQVVSFNTPRLCTADVPKLFTFTAAQAECDGDCVVCVESEVDGRAGSYSVSHATGCVCPVPARILRADAGTLTYNQVPDASADSDHVAASDAGGTSTRSADTRSGADSGVTQSPVAGSDGCLSQLHLSRSQAHARCSEWQDCYVCVERVDFDGDARAYMAHQCGCPEAHRVDPE